MVFCEGEVAEEVEEGGGFVARLSGAEEGS